jgi:trigger factor
MSILVPMAPVVELGDYKALTATRPPLEITEEEITSTIDDMRRRKSTREAVTDRGVQQGDVAVVNIKLAGEEGDGRTFMTIAGQTFAQLDEALMGMEAEQMKAVNLTFPENFQEKDWATKTFDCQLTLRSLSTMKLPELDDAFAKEFEVENLEVFKERVKESMQLQKASFFQNYVNEQLLEGLRSTSTVHVPDTMWLDVANQRLRETAIEQQKQGKTLEEFAKANNMTVEALIEAQKNEARIQVERAVMVQKIFELEEMKLTNNDLSDQLMVLAQEYNMDPKEVLNTLKKNNSVNELQFGAMFRKVLDKLVTFATITEETPKND